MVGGATGVTELAFDRVHAIHVAAVGVACFRKIDRVRNAARIHLHWIGINRDNHVGAQIVVSTQVFAEDQLGSSS